MSDVHNLPPTQLVDESGPPLLLGEVQRELAAMTFSRYQHSTSVDESTGTYKYDCSGLVDYALGRVLPDALAAFPTSTSSRPLARDIERYLRDGLSAPIAQWQAVSRVDDLCPGDLVAWLATEAKTRDTGHVMIVLDTAEQNAERPDEWLVRVADSALHPHAHDSRHAPEDGLGTGTIGLVADDGGAPTAFYWRGGHTEFAHVTEIALGRLT
jgi:hypothetical protein